MDNKKRLSILNKIKYKPIIIEKLYPLVINRVIILDYLISKDKILKKRLNNIFSHVQKYRNKLGVEYKILKQANFLEKRAKIKNEIYNKRKKLFLYYFFIKSGKLK